MLLTKVNIIGEVGYHVFRMNDGSVRIVECTIKEYKKLGMKGSVSPTIKGGVWTGCSYSNYKYDTPSGVLEDGMYAENDGRYAVKVKGKFQQDVKRKDITNHVLTKDL